MRAFVFLLALAATGVAQNVHRFGIFEATFTAPDDRTDLDIIVEFSGPGGTRDRALAFWDGGRTYKVRYSPERVGRYSYTVQSTDTTIAKQRGDFQVGAYKGTNGLYRAGSPRLSKDRRYLVQADGKPWFFLADTAWNGALLSTDDEWKRYLADRVAKRFTAIQLVTTQWRAGLKDEQGRVAFTGRENIQLQPQFFQRLDRKIQEVNEAGLVAVPVILWALTSKQMESPGEGLPTDQAKRLAKYIASRYAAHKVIWFLGGDGDYTGNNVEKWKEIGRATFPPDIRRPLVTMHPRGMRAPWDSYLNESWLDILIYQSGHGGDAKKWRWNATEGGAKDWRKEPVRPVIDTEPNYEGHRSYHGKEIGAYEVRRASYYSLLAAPPAGITYGAHGIWPWMKQAGVPLNHERAGVAQPWHTYLDAPGAKQMKVLRDVFNAIEWWRLRPNRTLLAQDSYNEETFDGYVMPAVADRGDFGLIYLPGNAEIRLNLTAFRGKQIQATWVDPRTGAPKPAGNFSLDRDMLVKTPSSEDWLLVLRAK